MSQVQKSKFVYKEAPANSNLLENMDNNELLWERMRSLMRMMRRRKL